MGTRATEPDLARLEVYLRVVESRNSEESRNSGMSWNPIVTNSYTQERLTACARHAPCWRTSWRSIQLMFVTYVLYRYPLIAECKKKNTEVVEKIRKRTRFLVFFFVEEYNKNDKSDFMKNPKNRVPRSSTSTRWQWKGLWSAIKVTISLSLFVTDSSAVDWIPKDVPEDARHVNVAMKSS